MIKKRQSPKIKKEKINKQISLPTRISPLQVINSAIHSSRNLFSMNSGDDCSPSNPEESLFSQKNLTDRSDLKRKKTILDDMGFSSGLDYKPHRLNTCVKSLNRLYGIQATDF